MCEPAYDAALREILNTGVSYPAARQRALISLGFDGSVLERPNDILGLEYCKAILQTGSRPRPLALLREGDYHAREADAENPSATSLRERLSRGEEIRNFIPAQAAEIYHSARQYDLFSGERAMLAGLRLLPEEAWSKTAHGSEGLWSKAMKAARREGEPGSGDWSDEIETLPQNENPETSFMRVSWYHAGGFEKARFPCARAGVR